MRWVDVPASYGLRTLAAWRETMRGAVGAASLDEAVERSERGSPGGAPIVLLAAGAVRAAWDHIAGSALERGGLLLGEPLVRAAADAAPAAVFLRAAVPGLDDEATGYSLRLGTSVWDAARAALAPGEVVVGWYHSHPDLGAFFSGTDQRTQAGLFAHPYSVGWVIDPVRREQAWFVGPRSLELPPHAVLALEMPAPVEPAPARRLLPDAC